MKKESNPPPPEGAKRPDPPPTPPKRLIREGVGIVPPSAPVKVQLTRKLSRKFRRAYVKQAQKDMKNILDKARSWPFRERLALGLKIIRGK
jgi:hypothetical protein